MSNGKKRLSDRAKQQDRANFDRGVNSLMRHLEELRPVLNNEDLDDRSINEAREMARAFVVSESGPDAASHIYKCSKEAILEIGKEGGFYHVFPEDAYLVWQTPEQWELMGTVLNTLVMLAQNSVQTRRRRELAQELRNRASDFVESLTGKPWTTNKSIMLKVNIATCMAELGNDQFEIDSQQAARWLKVLADHPGQWFSGKELSLHNTELLDIRTDKLKKELPKNLARLIESKPGRGSRLRLDWHGGRS